MAEGLVNAQRAREEGEMLLHIPIRTFIDISFRPCSALWLGEQWRHKNVRMITSERHMVRGIESKWPDDETITTESMAMAKISSRSPLSSPPSIHHCFDFRSLH